MDTYIHIYSMYYLFQNGVNTDSGQTVREAAFDGINEWVYISMWTESWKCFGNYSAFLRIIRDGRILFFLFLEKIINTKNGLGNAQSGRL
jgi:hypothetical protein